MNPLTRRKYRDERSQKIIVLCLALLIGATRLVAVAHAPFDWDEALFSLGVREYEVTEHHPHPPGYPLFIAAAKFFHVFGLSEFRSVQCVVLLGAFLLFPALFFLARELGFDFTAAAGGAAIFAFLPNVWVYGGTGFSDVPGTAAGLAACALLLRGRRDPRAYVVGAIALGIAAGIRPLNLLLGAVPALMATAQQIRTSWRSVVLAIVLGGAIAGGSYAGAAYASHSPAAYVQAVREQSEYVREVDSWRNPGRADLHDVAKVFFLWPIQQRQQMVGLAALALISLGTAIVRRRAAPLLALAVFAPVAVMSWLNLDVEVAGRYAIAYMAAHALLAADALGVLTRRRPPVQAILCGLVAAVFAGWTWPALTLQRTSDPPPVAALEWVRRHVPPESLVYIHGGIGPTAQYLLPDRRKSFYDTQDQISVMAGDAYVVDLHPAPGGQNFIWPRKSLWRVIRRRNFEASVSRVASRVIFGEGFYGPEGDDASPFQWMAGAAKATLPSFPGQGRLRVRLYVPVDTLATPPTIEVWLNGQLLERFAGATGTVEKSWTVPSRADALNELRITTSATVNPQRLGRGADGRDLGLRVDGLSWTPIR